MNFLSKPLFYLFGLIVCVCIFSCSQKNYPHDKPFVYENKINLKGNLSKNEKENILLNLPNYWADSLKARKVQQFGFFYKLNNPPVFDTSNILPSIAFMKSYLRSQGFYTTELTADTSLSVHDDQQRISVTMNVNPGKVTIIDSVAYDFNIKKLQQIANGSSKSSFLIPKKTPFVKDIIAAELDRLVTAFRQKGYYLLTRDNIVAEVDTTDVALMQLITDPAEFAQKIAEAAEKRKQNPTCIVTIKLRNNPDADSTKLAQQLMQYRVGEIYYYPEMQRTDFPDSMISYVNEDTIKYKSDTLNKHTMYYTEGEFHFKPLRQHTYIRPGLLYNETNYFKTINNLNQMGAWRQIDTRDSIRKDTVDFHFFLYPAKKQNISYDFEISRNTGDFLTSSNLFGLAFNTSYLNRNVLKEAIQAATTFTNGVELTFDPNTSLLQTIQSSITQTFSFPKVIPAIINKQGSFDIAKSQLDFNASYIDRKDFFRLRSLTTDWGIFLKKKNTTWQVKFPNLEFYSLDTLALLDSAFKVNPFLRTSFNIGTVISLQASVLYTFAGKRNPNSTNLLRAGIELAPLPFANSWQFYKIEGEARKLYQLRNNSFALRAFVGIGNSIGKGEFGNSLPFFKQYIAGGPNSMRAWNLRQLGLGSSLLSDTSSTFRERYGDIQLETNIEYRYRIANIGGVLIGSALFADIGNIWNWKHDPNNPLAQFSFNNLGHDIAIGVGTGLRLDFSSYFLIRLDFGVKIKNPAQLENNGWNIKDFTWRNKEFTIIDPNTQRVVERNNYAFQLGIGLPF